MKKMILITSALMITFLFAGQKPDKKVLDAFQQKFQNAEDVEWSRESSNEWEAEFEINDQDMSACFDNSGNWLETEKEVCLKDIPAEVFKSIVLKYEKFEIEEAEGVETPDFKGYEIAIEIHDTEIELLITDSGKMTIKDVKFDDEDHDKKHEEHEDDED